MGKPFGGALELKQLATPAGNPASGAMLLYFKADGKLYAKNQSGVEAAIDTAAGGPANMVTTDTSQTITGVKTLNAIPLFNLPSGVNSLSGTQLTGASMRVWHDRMRFSAPTYETSADGVGWTTQAAGTGRGVFTARSDQPVSIDNAARYVRWTWNDSSLSYGGMQRLLLKFAYVTPAPNVVVTVWSSADGNTWTQRLAPTTLSSTSANAFALPVTDNSSDGWYRIQYQVVGGGASGAVARPNGIEVQTARWGDQGSGDERETPYYWDYSRLIGFYNTIRPMSDAAFDLGQSGARWRDCWMSGTLNVGTLNPTNALPQSKTHASPDTDASGTALHHTLGSSANQAAPGNHTHTAAAVGAEPTLGTGTASQFLRGDKVWATPPDTNTTYPTPTQAEAEAGTATTPSAFTAERVKQAIISLAPLANTVSPSAPASPKNGAIWLDTDEPGVSGGTLAGLGSNTFTGKQTITSSGGAVTPVEVKGTSNQSSDLQQWTSGSGSIVAKMTAKGMYIPSSFDLRNIPPTFITSMQLSQNAVMQNVVKGPVTGELFASQTDNAATETFWITRMTAQGTLKDYMCCRYGGHGTSFYLEQDPDGTTWITLPWAEAAPAGAQNDIVRFKYDPTFTTAAPLYRSNTSKFTVRPKFGLGYVIPIVDEKNDNVVFRISGPDAQGVTQDNFQLRKRSEWLAGVDNVLATIGPIQVTVGDGTQPYWTPQGWALNDWQLFFYSGNSAQTNENLLSAYTFQPGQNVTAADYRVSTANIAKDPVDGSIDDNFHEPEGISFYRDPNRGDLTLLIGVTTGPQNQRRHKLFAFNALNADRLIGETLKALDTPRWEKLGSSFGANYGNVSGRYPAAFRIWPNNMVEWTGCVQNTTGPIPSGVTDLISVPDRAAPTGTLHFACGASGPALPITRIAVTKLPNSVIQNGRGDATIDWVDLSSIRYDKNPDSM